MGSLVTTTTLAALLANNTSAYSGYVWNNTDSPSLIPSNYTIASNFNSASLWDKSRNLSPINVSRESLATLLGAAVTNPPMFLWIPWWGGNAYDHINIGQNEAISNIEAVKQVADMAARGGAACIDFYNTKHGAAQNYFRDACIAAGLPFTVMLDSNMSPQVTTTAGLNALMDTINTDYFSKAGYLKVGGRPVIVDFGFEGFGSITWATVRTHISALSQGNPIWLGRFTGPSVSTRGGFLDGFYGWPSPSDGVTTYASNFYTYQAAHPALVYWGPIYKGFSDVLASWGTGRFIAQNNGQTYLDTINGIKAHGPMQSAMVATWNDYEEGTAVEMGVGAGANLAVTPTLSGTVVSWTTAGNTACIAKYRVWASLNGTAYGQLGGDLSAATSSYDLSTSGVTDAGTYHVRVQAVGISSVVNAMSSTVDWSISLPAGPLPTADTPTLFPAGGNYSAVQTVAISSAVPGAIIHYTTDATIPTNASAIYSGPITVSATTTVNAMVEAFGYVNSGIASATYVLTLPVVVVTPSSVTPSIAATTVTTAPPQANQFISLGEVLRGPIVDEKGNPTRNFLKKMQEQENKLATTLDLLGQLSSAIKIKGRSEGIGTTVGNLDPSGVVLPAGVDLSRAYVNKTVDHIDDGNTYQRTLATALTAGQVDLTAAGVIGPLGSAKINQNVMFNYSNNATVDSIDNGVNATIRVYGPGGVGTTWHQFIGSVIGPENPAFSGTTAYGSDRYVYFDGNSFFITATPSDVLADGLQFCAKVHTVSAGGGGGVSGGGGSGGGGGGRISLS